MAEEKRKNWRELCNAALEARDPDELLKILQQLNQALKREEQVQRHFREATRANKSSGEIRFNNYRSDLSLLYCEEPQTYFAKLLIYAAVRNSIALGAKSARNLEGAGTFDLSMASAVVPA